jgi:oligopeptide/dipeptide ABC transporter ATP-binding protein
MGRYDQVLDAPLHPYTVALGEAIPVPDPERERARTSVISTRAEVPESTPAITVGCPYAPRCPLVEAHCREVAPTLLEKYDGHFVSCHVAIRQSSSDAHAPL